MVDLFGGGAQAQEQDGNRGTRHKIYLDSGRRYDIKPYVLCSVICYMMPDMVRCVLRGPLPALYSRG
jgi:hypothetical protein